MLLEYDVHNIIKHNYNFENRKSKEYMYVMQHNSLVKSHIHKNNMQLVGEY